MDTIKFLCGFHLSGTVRTRVLFQSQEVVLYVFPDVRVEFSKGSIRGGRDFHAICQVLVSEFFHQISQRPRSLLLRFLQGRMGRLQIDTVQLLFRQALEQAEVGD